jgi:hypothetical protein
MKHHLKVLMSAMAVAATAATMLSASVSAQTTPPPAKATCATVRSMDRSIIRTTTPMEPDQCRTPIVTLTTTGNTEWFGSTA